MHASHNGQWEVVIFLLAKGAHVDVKTFFGQTPLIDACRACRADVIKALLDTGAVDINACDKLGQTGLHLAARWDNVDVVRLLFDNGADVNRQTLVCNLLWPRCRLFVLISPLLGGRS